MNRSFLTVHLPLGLLLGLLAPCVVRADLDDAMVGAYGTTTFDGDVDATVDYVVIYSENGVSYDDLNQVLDTGDTDGNDVNLDENDDAQPSGGTAYNESHDMTFLYQITGTSDADYVRELVIKSFGFTPSTAGYFGDFSLAISGTDATLTEPGSLNTPGEFATDLTLTAGDDAFGWSWSNANRIGNGDNSPLLYAQFNEVGMNKSWFSMYDNDLRGGGQNEQASLPSPNPEPGSLALLGAAVAGFGGFRRFRRRRNAEQQPADTEADAATTSELD